MASISDHEIQLLAADLESDRVERKESFDTKRDEIAQAICAFANDLPCHQKPGFLLLGVRDKSGLPSGLAVTDQLLLSVASLRSDGNIQPLPNITVEKRQLRGIDIVLVAVEPSGDTPVAYKGRVWVRVGPRRAIASRDEERVLNEKRRSADLAYDRRGCPAAKISDLDVDYFRSEYVPAAVARDVLSLNSRTDEERLCAMRFLDTGGHPTHAALLLFAKDPRAWVPGAYVQFARFDGNDLTDPILDQKVLDGPLPAIVAKARDLLALNIRIETRINDQPVERRLPDYPSQALIELLSNAIVHRSYEVHAPVYWYWFADRVEIQSPGGLYGRVTEAAFGKPGMTDYRNMEVAIALKNLGFVQQFGMGLRVASHACAANGNAAPAFEFGTSAVSVSVERRR
jgi:ATP-dependent DNA helicase RecG